MKKKWMEKSLLDNYHTFPDTVKQDMAKRGIGFQESFEFTNPDKSPVGKSSSLASARAEELDAIQAFMESKEKKKIPTRKPKSPIVPSKYDQTFGTENDFRGVNRGRTYSDVDPEGLYRRSGDMIGGRIIPKKVLGLGGALPLPSTVQGVVQDEQSNLLSPMEKLQRFLLRGTMDVGTPEQAWRAKGGI